MRALSAQCHVAIDVVEDIVLLNDSIGMFSNQNSLFIIFIDLVLENERKCFVVNFDAAFPVEADQIVLRDLTSIFLALDQDPIELIAAN